MSNNKKAKKETPEISPETGGESTSVSTGKRSGSFSFNFRLSDPETYELIDQKELNDRVYDRNLLRKLKEKKKKTNKGVQIEGNRLVDHGPVFETVRTENPAPVNTSPEEKPIVHNPSSKPFLYLNPAPQIIEKNEESLSEAGKEAVSFLNKF